MPYLKNVYLRHHPMRSVVVRVVRHARKAPKKRALTALQKGRKAALLRRRAAKRRAAARLLAQVHHVRKHHVLYKPALTRVFGKRNVYVHRLLPQAVHRVHHVFHREFTL